MSNDDYKWPKLPIEMDDSEAWQRALLIINDNIDKINKLERIVNAAQEVVDAASPITYTPDELARIPIEQVQEAWQNLHKQLATVTTMKQLRTPMSKADSRKMFETAHALYKEKYPNDNRPIEEVFKGLIDLDSGYPEA